MTAVYCRKPTIVNADPLGRCYNGAFISSERRWSPWFLVCAYTHDSDARDSADTFARINPSWEYDLRPE